MVRQRLLDPGEVGGGGLLLPGLGGPMATARQVFQLGVEFLEVYIATVEKFSDSLPYLLLGWCV